MEKMKNNSRTTNTIYNFTSSIGGQLLTIIMQFAVRTVFIKKLGESYLGISGLFSNILSMLSLAEFGVGSAILFKLYEPIAKKDTHRIALLMKFYRTVYQIIGIVVAVIGLCLIPFLPYLMKDYERLETLHINAVLIYLLYLTQTVSSYLFFAYKSAIVKANQKEYLLNIISYFFTIVAGLVQIVTLMLFHNFIIYVVVAILQIIGQNLASAIFANKQYPYINEKTEEKISSEEVKEVFKDCSALFLYKLNGVVLKATDNIILSAFIGLDIVALYTNYYVFYTTINSLFNKVFGSVSHSLGNLHTSHDTEHEYQVFESVNLITMVLGGTAGVGIFVVADEFVNTWIGAEWVLAQPFSLLMGLEVFTLASRISLSKYRTTMGLFQQAKLRPLFGMIINLAVSILLVNFWGISGVLVGTLVADWTTFMWFDPLIIHKHGFKNIRPVTQYYFKLLKYMAVIAVTGAVDFLICTNLLTGHGWISVIVHAVICGLTVPMALIAISYHTQEGQYVYHLALSYVKKILGKIQKRG